jgi:8-oxo-dGTP pyrophosphatase MutT (NUDIX family)
MLCSQKKTIYTSIMKATVVFPMQQNKVLLGRKMLKVGAGKWNGYGGKPEPEDATIRHTACRELFEETGKGIMCQPEDLSVWAKIDFFLFDNQTSDPNFSVIFYTAEHFSGTAVQTAEMESPTWFAIDSIPYNEMLPADRDFIPKIFAGEVFVGTVRFNADMSEVLTSSYHPTTADLLEI